MWSLIYDSFFWNGWKFPDKEWNFVKGPVKKLICSKCGRTIGQSEGLAVDGRGKVLCNECRWKEGCSK
jgi:formylmethanofuran dehydrogenase subunit E